MAGESSFRVTFTLSDAEMGNPDGGREWWEEKKLDRVENPQWRTRDQLTVGGLEPPQRPWVWLDPLPPPRSKAGID